LLEVQYFFVHRLSVTSALCPQKIFNMKPRTLLFFTLIIISLICLDLNYAQENDNNADNAGANNNENALPSSTTSSTTSTTSTTATTTTSTSAPTTSTTEKSQAQQDETSPQATNATNATPAELDQETNAQDIPIPIPTIPLLSESDADDLTGGGVWSSIGLVAVVICGCICLERLYSSCKKVYQKRTGRYGFSRLQNQTFNEFEDEDDDEDDDDLEESLGHRTTMKTSLTKDSDEDSV